MYVCADLFEVVECPMIVEDDNYVAKTPFSMPEPIDNYFASFQKLQSTIADTTTA